MISFSFRTLPVPFALVMLSLLAPASLFARESEKGTTVQADFPDMFYEVWEFWTYTVRESSGETYTLGVWGPMQFHRDGTYSYELHIGQFMNNHSGTWTVDGDRMVLTENGQVFQEFVFALNETERVLTLVSQREEGGADIYELKQAATDVVRAGVMVKEMELR